MAACTGCAEPDSLEHPETAMLRRDASGYAVDCGLVDQDDIPDVDPSRPRRRTGPRRGRARNPSLKSS